LYILKQNGMRDKNYYYALHGTMKNYTYKGFVLYRDFKDGTGHIKLYFSMYIFHRV